MSHFLSLLPIWALVLLVVIIPTAVAVILQIFIRHWIGVDRLGKNNEIAGFMFATVGVVYAVLLAFVVIAVWEKFSEGQTSVAREAGAAAALFHYASGPEPEAAELHKALVDYLELAIRKDWPAMAAGSEDAESRRALNALYRSAMALNHTGTRNTADMTEVFTQIDALTSSRSVRLHLSTGLVPDVIWIALFAGAGLTVCFTLFFGAANLLAQVTMTVILSILLTLGLVVIVSLDHPFSGPVHIAPEALERVLANSTEG